MSVLRLTRNGKTEVVALNRTAITLGRGTECQVVVADPSAARQHCQVVMTDRGFLVRDLSGQGGVLVNGKKVSEQALREGDTIQIGAVRIQYSASAAAPAKQGATGTIPAGGKPASAAPTRPVPTAARPGGTTTRMIDRPPGTGTGTIPKPAAAGTAPRPAGAGTGTIPKAAGTGTRPIDKTGATTGSIPKAAAPARSAPSSGVRAGSGQAGTGTLQAKPATTAVPSARPATGQVPKAAAARTGTERVLPSRGRGGTTSLRMASRRAAMKRGKPRGGFNLPATRKGRTIMACVAIGLLAVIGVLGWLWSQRLDPEKIKAELKERFEKDVKDRVSKGDVVKADDESHKLMDDDRFKKYAAQERRDGVESFHRGLHEKAELQRKADAEVIPVMKEFEEAKSRPDFRVRAQELWDKVQSLKDNYASTTWGDKLTEAMKALQAEMEKLGAEDTELIKKFFPIKRDSEEAARSGDLVKALKQLSDFDAQYHASEKPEVSSQLKDVRDACRRLADSAVGKLVAESDVLIGQKGFDKAKAKLEAARPGVKGTPLEKKLDEALKKVEDERKKSK